jgi:hypothetical protein
MRALLVLAAAVGALALPLAAAAGGWATVGFEPLPDGMSAGGTWKPTIFVKQHGVTPLAGLQPLVVIEDAETGETMRFSATEASETGAYSAAVVFPAAGDWRITIHSGFGDSQVTYGPVRIGAPGSGSDSPVLPLAVAGLALVAGLLLLGARRYRRLAPASS